MHMDAMSNLLSNHSFKSDLFSESVDPVHNVNNVKVYISEK